MIRWPYLLVWSFASIACHRVTESLESEEVAHNTTTLYPVLEASYNVSGEVADNNDSAKESDTTSWKIEAAFAEPKLPDFKDNQTETKETKEDKPGNCTKEFRPSPPLGILEENGDSLPTRGIQDNFVPLRKPAVGFHSSHHSPVKPALYSPPREIFKQPDFPYKIENTIFTRAKGWSSLETRPTVEAPVRVPAGGLYQSAGAFKDKPGLDSDDDNFGLEFNSDVKVKDSSADIKKRVNPWKNLLRLATAFIPVGLIISALTPSVITIEDTGPDTNRYPPPLLRRSSRPGSGLDSISEPCRRRLLCELHSERNYLQNQTPRRRGKLCYKLPCEDPEALSRTLQWLLAYHHDGNDSRGRVYN